MSNDKYTINTEAFEQLSNLFGDDFGHACQTYQNSVREYLSTIQEHLNQDLEKIVRPAHTIKSSSRQFGFTSLANYAEQLEKLAADAHSQQKTVDKDILEELFHNMNHAYENALTFIEHQNN